MLWKFILHITILYYVKFKLFSELSFDYYIQINLYVDVAYS